MIKELGQSGSSFIF